MNRPTNRALGHWLAVILPASVIGSVSIERSGMACDTCGCARTEGAVCTPHLHADGSTHRHPVSNGNSSTAAPNGLFGGADGTSSSYTRFDVPRTPLAGTTRFVVLGDTQGLSAIEQLITDMNVYNPELFITAGDLVSTGSVGAWNQWLRLTDHFVGGPESRFAVPGNHDLPVGGDLQWQQTFHWLPDSRTVGGETGIDQMDYYFDRGRSRFISVTTDSQANGAYGQPAAIQWLDNVLQLPSTQAMEHVFVFSHHPITYQNESGTGGTTGDWWQVMANSGVVDAVFTGHWHLYQPSRPDPASSTWEMVLGTGGGTLEGFPWQAQHGFTLIDVAGPRVEATFFGDADHDGTYDDILDQQVIRDAVPPPNGLVAYYSFNFGHQTNVDSAPTELAKQNHGAYEGGASTVSDGVLGNALSVDGGDDFAHGGAIGDYNMAIVGDLTISLHANFDHLSTGDDANTLVAYSGRIPFGAGSTYGPQESTNHAYHFSLTGDRRLRVMWEHDDAEEVVVTSDAPANVSSGQWHHYVFTRDATTGEVNFYVDGVQLGAAIPFTDLPTGGGNGLLHIGNGIDADSGFDGLIDELTIYNEVLLPSEVFLGPPPGDMNGDGVVSGDGTGTAATDDVTAFVEGWRTVGHANVAQQIAHGDLNLDGITDLSDWGILNAFDPSMGVAILSALRRASVPEPGSLTLALVACSLLTLLQRRSSK